MNKFFSYIAKLTALSVIAALFCYIFVCVGFSINDTTTALLVWLILAPLLIYLFTNVACFIEWIWTGSLDHVKKSFREKFVSSLHLVLPSAIIGWMIMIWM